MSEISTLAIYEPTPDQLFCETNSTTESMEWWTLPGPGEWEYQAVRIEWLMWPNEN